jgi:hypothetical protein
MEAKWHTYVLLTPCAGAHLGNVFLAVTGQQLFICCLHRTGRKAVCVQMRTQQQWMWTSMLRHAVLGPTNCLSGSTLVRAGRIQLRLPGAAHDSQHKSSWAARQLLALTSQFALQQEYIR